MFPKQREWLLTRAKIITFSAPSSSTLSFQRGTSSTALYQPQYIRMKTSNVPWKPSALPKRDWTPENIKYRISPLWQKHKRLISHHLISLSPGRSLCRGFLFLRGIIGTVRSKKTLPTPAKAHKKAPPKRGCTNQIPLTI